MARIIVPAMVKGRIAAVRSITKGLVSASKAAGIARDRALEKYGPLSDKYDEAVARADESVELLMRLYNRLLKPRLDELEGPFREGR